MPWNPGQSGNPGGNRTTKPIRDAIFMELAAADEGREDPVPKRSLRMAIRQQLDKASSGDLAALQFLAERIEGNLRRLEPGDLLMVTRLDRLARSTRDLLNVLDMVAKAGAGFRSLADVWADTTTMHGRLMLTVLGGLAEFERELIRARTGEGRSRAKARGVRFGRPPKLSPFQRQEALQRLSAGDLYADIARSYGVDPTTIGRLAARG
jgi:Resolvase, N terminal domain/Family of unknown function (DUF5681)